MDCREYPIPDCQSQRIVQSNGRLGCSRSLLCENETHARLALGLVCLRSNDGRSRHLQKDTRHRLGSNEVPTAHNGHVPLKRGKGTAEEPRAQDRHQVPRLLKKSRPAIPPHAKANVREASRGVRPNCRMAWRQSRVRRVFLRGRSGSSSIQEEAETAKADQWVKNEDTGELAVLKNQGRPYEGDDRRYNLDYQQVLQECAITSDSVEMATSQRLDELALSITDKRVSDLG